MTKVEMKLDLTKEMKEEEEESESVTDFHSCGIGRFCLNEETLVCIHFLVRFRLNEDTLVCVDGQQRLTTTSLLVAAIRCFIIKRSLLTCSFAQGQVERS